MKETKIKTYLCKTNISLKNGYKEKSLQKTEPIVSYTSNNSLI
jgi:hypothetical protein